MRKSANVRVVTYNQGVGLANNPDVAGTIRWGLRVSYNLYHDPLLHQFVGHLRGII